jgi:hypothetical protein
VEQPAAARSNEVAGGSRASWRRWLWIAPIVLPLASCGGCYGYATWWWAGAEAAVQATVNATAARRSPEGIAARVDSSAALRPSVDFRFPYEIEGADNYLTGTSLSDLLSLGAWVAHLHFANGHVYHAEARRDAGTWVVEIGPAEGE